MTAHLVYAAPLAAGRVPDRIGLHLLFALGVLLLFVAFVGALRRAWVRRAEQQEDELPDLPEPPDDPGTVAAAPLRGMYLGTVDAGHWLEWISGRGLGGGRAGAYVTVYSSGVQVDRDGTAFWIAREAVRGARLERAHAGKVASPGRLVVIAWSFDGHELETGFRGEDRARQPKVVRAVHDLIGPAPTVPGPGEITNPRGMPRGRLRLRTRTEGGAQPPAGRGGLHPPAPRGSRLPTPRPARPPRPAPVVRPEEQTDIIRVARPYAVASQPGASDPRGSDDPRGGPRPTGEAPTGEMRRPGGEARSLTGEAHRPTGEPHGGPEPRSSPETTPIPVVVRARPAGPVPAAPSRADWPQSQPWRPEQQPPEQQRPEQHRPAHDQVPFERPPVERPGPVQQRPDWAQPRRSPDAPGGYQQDADAAYVDPLTSPLGQVVRRMRDEDR